MKTDKLERLLLPDWICVRFPTLLPRYKAGEERRTHAVLAKCTKLLNEKKRKIQSLKH